MHDYWKWNDDHYVSLNIIHVHFDFHLIHFVPLAGISSPLPFKSLFCLSFDLYAIASSCSPTCAVLLSDVDFFSIFFLFPQLGTWEVTVTILLGALLLVFFIFLKRDIVKMQINQMKNNSLWKEPYTQ